MVATLMRARGLTIGQLADEVGIHRNRLGDKIAGRMAFREQDILALAEALGVKPGQLFDDPLERLGSSLSTSSRCTELWAGQRAWGNRTGLAVAARHLQLVA